MYTVNWTMDIYAETARDAAEYALRVHRNPSSIATVFEVIDGDGLKETIDLWEDE